MKGSNLAKKIDVSMRDRYEKDLGQLPDIEPPPVRTTDTAALIESMRCLQRTTRRLTAALIFLTAIVVALAVADHGSALQAWLLSPDHWPQQWLR